MLRFFLHYGIHFLVPILIGTLLIKENKIKATLILLGAILIDIDHLIANPIFDSFRCSINYHPLHSYWAIGFYALLLFNKKTQIFGIGLLIHIIADLTDCCLIGINSN